MNVTSASLTISSPTLQTPLARPILPGAFVSSMSITSTTPGKTDFPHFTSSPDIKYTSWVAASPFFFIRMPPAAQRKIPHDVEHFVPDEFLGIAQRLGREHGVIANNDRVFEAAAFDEAVLEKQFDLVVKTKRACVRQFVFPGFRRDGRAVKLREASLFVRTGAGDLEVLVGKHRHHRLT